MHAFEPDTTIACPRWDVVDVVFAGPEGLTDPFGVHFGAAFTGPDGGSLRILGFCDGDRRFVLRFSPPAAGTWTFETFATIPSLAGLRGTVEAAPAAPGCHGPVGVDPANPRRLAYADGSPYFALAFEADWLYALDWDNAEGIPGTQTLVDQIAAAGFNQVVMNVYAYDVPWAKDPGLRPEHEYGVPGTYPFLGTNEAPDYAGLNTAFFQHLDRVVRCLDRAGIVAHLMIYVWNKLVQWPEMYSPADNRYFDHVIARYQAFPNVLWDVSKEALGYGRCDMAYVSERIRRLRRLDAYGRLVTVHDYAYCSSHPEMVDLISIQTWRTDLHAEMVRVCEHHAGKPVLNIEHGGYEEGPYVVFPGDYTDPEACLARNYECVFAGAYSTYYWQGTSWNVIIPDPMGLPEIVRPHFGYYTHLAALFERYDYARLAPVPGRASSGYCLADGQGLLLYYMPEGNYAFHISPPPDASGDARVTWFNPLSGEYVDRGTVVVREWHEFRSPWAEQIAVLILEIE